MNILKFEIHNAKEFKDTLDAGYPVLYAIKNKSCVVPEIIGYFRNVINDKDEKMCGLVLREDQKNEAYLNHPRFNKLAINGLVHADMLIRLFKPDEESMDGLYNSISRDIILFSPLILVAPEDLTTPSINGDNDESDDEGNDNSEN